MNINKVAERCESASGLSRERWALLLEQLSEIDEVVPSLIKAADREYWVVEALRRFLELAVNNKQDISLESVFRGKEFIEVNKLVKVNRLIPKVYLDLHKFKYVILGSVYVEMPTVIINKDLSSILREMENDSDFLNYGLPGNYHYGTRQFSYDGYLVALGYNELCPLYITTMSDWSYFELW